MTSKIPRGTYTERNTAHKPDVDPEMQREKLPRKKTVGKTTKGTSSRYGQEAELREQNQNLLATNDELRKNLQETQQKVKELEGQYSSLQKEKDESEKQLKNCHALLVSAKVDPVLGEGVGDVARENEKLRKTVWNISAVLVEQFSAIGDLVDERCNQLQALKSNLSQFIEEREQMRLEREMFATEAAELEETVNEAEAFLF